MEKEKINCLSVVSFLIFLSAFVSIYLFVNIQQDKYNYYLYIYGEKVSPGSNALIKVFSRDGEFLSNQTIYVNGQKKDSFLINLRPDLKEIKIKTGNSDVIFPVTYKELEELRFSETEYIHIGNNETENISLPASAGQKTIYLLPDQFKVISEFETKTHLFCVEKEKPCVDNSLEINGTLKEMKSGYLSFTTVFTHEKSVNLVFSDGSSVTAKIPYSGKMFKFFPSSSGIVLASLIDVKNVNVDCYSKDKWIGTDIISVHQSGTKLPDTYLHCDFIQASFNSSNPGTSFVTYSKSSRLIGNVSDPYYFGLAKYIKNFPQTAQISFFTNYNSSFFKPLPLIFSGDVLEKRFNEKRSEKLEFLWWMILLSAFAGLSVFVTISAKKIKIVEGIDGELITRSMATQRLMLAFAAFLYISFVAMLLYLLKNLA